MARLSTTASEVIVEDLSFFVIFELLPEFSHTSSDSHIVQFIGGLEVVEYLKFGIILFLGIFIQIQPR